MRGCLASMPVRRRHSRFHFAGLMTCWTLGVSIGQIMRDLAQEMRRRRRAVAQERAQKAPIKILFPLVFLIFPAMFVVLLGPALFLFFRAFGGG